MMEYSESCEGHERWYFIRTFMGKLKGEGAPEALPCPSGSRDGKANWLVMAFCGVNDAGIDALLERAAASAGLYRKPLK